MNNELQIIEGCKKRSRKAQKMLFDTYSSVLFPICMRYSKNKQEAEDILQESFIKIFSSIDQFADEGSFVGWLKKIVVNTAISSLKQDYKYFFHENVDDFSNDDDYDSVEPEFDYSLQDLLKIINELPEGYRIIFNMAVIEEYKHKDIADILDIDIGTSKSQLSRAKKMLQKRLTELNEKRILEKFSKN
jgi:RNA polymerase sigma-70 factor (ECF subfamily)